MFVSVSVNKNLFLQLFFPIEISYLVSCLKYSIGDAWNITTCTHTHTHTQTSKQTQLVCICIPLSKWHADMTDWIIITEQTIHDMLIMKQIISSNDFNKHFEGNVRGAKLPACNH